jgi:hypothetical protein
MEKAGPAFLFSLLFSLFSGKKSIGRSGKTPELTGPTLCYA